MKKLILLASLSIPLMPATSHAGWFSNPAPSPLEEASVLNDSNNIKILIKNGADVNAVNKSGQTALHKAVEKGNKEAVQELLKNGANINARDKKGQTALHNAVKNGNKDIVKLLVDKGADLNITDIYGYTPLQYAVKAQNIELVNLLAPEQVTAVATDAAFPVAIPAVAAASGGGISGTTVAVTGAAAAGAAGVAAAAGGGGGGSGSGSSSSPSNPPSSPSSPPSSPPPSSSGACESSSFATSEYCAQYGLKNSNASKAYERGYTGAGVVVAVVDTGADYDNPDLAPNLLAGYDFVNNDNNADDDNTFSHGSHVSGVVAAVKNDSGVHGIAYGAKVLPVKVLNSSGGGFTDDVADGIVYATDNGADVINLSLGANIAMDDIKTAIKYSVDNGVLVVAAAGNSAGSEPTNPAGFASDNTINNASQTGALIAVGAVGSNNVIASFSNRCGSAKDWCMVAPGVNILSTVSGGYSILSGTSMADPHVSGAAAVLMQAFPHLSAHDVAEILLTTATDLGASGVDSIYGHGLLNLDKATDPVGSTSVPTGNNVNGGSLSLSGASINASAAFGDAFTASDVKLGILDDYNRLYKTSIAGFVEKYQLSFLDKNFRDYGFNRLVANKSALNDNSYIAFDSEVVHESDSPEEENDTKNKALFSFGNEDKELSMSYGITADNAIAIANNINQDAYLSTAAFKNPFLGFAEESFNSISRFKLDKFTIGFTSFLGNEENGNNSMGFAENVAYKFSDKFSLGFNFGIVSEDNAFLSGNSSGALAIGDKANTVFYGLDSRYNIIKDIDLFASFTGGVTTIKENGASVFDEISKINTSSFYAGAKYKNLSFVISQPLRAENGYAALNVAESRDINGNLSLNRQTINLSPSGREIDFETSYQLDFGSNSGLNLGAMYRTEPDHIKNNPNDLLLLMRFKYSY